MSVCEVLQVKDENNTACSFSFLYFVGNLEKYVMMLYDFNAKIDIKMSNQKR